MVVYHGSSVSFDGPVKAGPIKTFNDVGGWFTSSKKNAALYGPKVGIFEDPKGRFEKGNPSFAKTFFDYHTAVQVYDSIAVADVLKKVSDGKPVKIPEGMAARWATKDPKEFFRKLVFASHDYLKQWKARKNTAGIHWENSTIDNMPENHDVWLVFAPERVKRVSTKDGVSFAGLIQEKNFVENKMQYISKILASAAGGLSYMKWKAQPAPWEPGKYELGYAAIYICNVNQFSVTDPYILDCKNDGWFRKRDGKNKGLGLQLRGITLANPNSFNWSEGRVYEVSIAYESPRSDEGERMCKAYLYVERTKTPEEIIKYIKRNLNNWVEYD